MQREIHKISGIYQITNKINGKIYVGYSQNITLRWYLHIDDLMKGVHANYKLQSDYNEYGLANFNFSVLDIIKNKKELILKEQEYLNNMIFEENYNLINGNLSSKEEHTEAFINYIDNNWLINTKMSNAQVNGLRIYNKEQRQKILQKAIECNLIPDKFPSQITFNMVIHFMEKKLGYIIFNGRFKIKPKHYSYKLIAKRDSFIIEEIDEVKNCPLCGSPYIDIGVNMAGIYDAEYLVCTNNNCKNSKT
jgi:group I intron endonuclease